MDVMLLSMKEVPSFELSELSESALAVSFDVSVAVSLVVLFWLSIGSVTTIFGTMKYSFSTITFFSY